MKSIPLLWTVLSLGVVGCANSPTVNPDSNPVTKDSDSEPKSPSDQTAKGEKSLASKAPLPTSPQMVKIPAGRFVMGSTCRTAPKEDIGKSAPINPAQAILEAVVVGDCPQDDPKTSVDESAVCKKEGQACEGWRNERPAHTVTISRPFLMATTEVTQKEWYELMGSNPAQFTKDVSGKKADSHPVERVSLWDAMAYLNALSVRDGLPACYDLSGCKGTPGGVYDCMQGGQSQVSVTAASGRPTACTGYRLPTEAEWEYAARAGTTGLLYGPLDRIAWNFSNSANSTHPVATKEPNAWGLYDMIGNVWEWTGDWDGKYSADAVTDPVGPALGSNRVSRGCSWHYTIDYCRVSFRMSAGAMSQFGHMGFRVARSLP